MGLLTGKTALITGAARGIGKAIALKFAEEGANIAFTDLVIDENGKATEAEIAAKGVKAKGYASNAADFAQTADVVNQVKEDFGSIDILVNNAGITKDGLMMRMTEAQWDAVIAVNLKSAFNFIHACTPIMMRQKSGSIINMASVVGVHGNAGQCNYAASKAGLIALAKSIGQEIGSRGIRANAIAPGFIETAMTQALPDNIRKEWIQKIPLRRAGQVEDIANVATFLASDLSSYVVVIDDPFTSFDSHRKMTTITQLSRLAKKVNQFFLLTHDLHFANDFNNACNEQTLNLKIQNLNGSSVLFLHDIRVEMLTGFNKDLMTLRRFLDGKIPEDAIYLREVIRCIRPTIEGIFRIKYFRYVQETQWLGDFIQMIRDADSASPFYKLKPYLNEIEEINDYSKTYHHSNPNYIEVGISSIELRNYVKRTIALIENL